MTIHWRTVPFDALTLREVHDLFKLRVDIFVVEQRCAYPEVDGHDIEALHVLGANEAGQLVACARILPAPSGGLRRIGRVVVHPDLRGSGIAHQLMDHVLDTLNERFGTRSSMLSAQAQLESFYSDHGFVRTGPAYDWDGIPHVDMEHRDDRQAQRSRVT
jgi:ElaA protein